MESAKALEISNVTEQALRKHLQKGKIGHRWQEKMSEVIST
jgi:post-segregation antitoxin (ccd killing protein)